MTKLKLSAPWTTYYREIQCMFKYDPEVDVQFDEENGVINLQVLDGAKADVLKTMLPEQKTFGNVSVTVNITHIRPNMEAPKECASELMQIAFDKNEAVASIETVKDLAGRELVFVVFKADVVSFFNDDLTDINGYAHMLYQDIARELFTVPVGVNFCTELSVEDKAEEEPVAEEPVAEAPVEE